MNITELKDKINALDLLNQFPDIHGYALALKEVGGETTNNLCVQFYVEEKKSLEQLTPGQILPTTLDTLGVDVITDVKQANKNYHLGINTNEIPLSSNISGVNYFNNPDNKTILPLSINYYKNRPLIGGSSSIYIGGTDATLGLLVTDSTDNSIVALSNAHVYAASQYIGLDALSGNRLNTLSLSSRQPGTFLYGPFSDADPQKDFIGTHKRCVVLTSLSSNYVDCALTQLSSYTLVNAMSTQVNGFQFTGPYQFASSQEIDSLLDINSPNFNAPIFRNGRTLGPMGYPGNIFTKSHLTPDPSIPIKEIPIPNIEAAWFADMHGVSITPNYALIVKTVDGHHWASNDEIAIIDSISWHKYFPTIPSIDSFAYLGKFDYLTITDEGSIGLSGNKLVHWGSAMYDALTSKVGLINGPGQGSGQYMELPANLQLNDYTGLKTIIPCVYNLFGDSYSWFLLKGEELYSVGVNGRGTLGFGSSGDRVNSWTRVPGNWKSITNLPNENAVLALSTSGDVFITATSERDQYTDIPPFSNMHNLTANNLNIGKHISIAADYLSYIWTLSANNTTTKLNKYTYKDNLSAYTKFTYSDNWSGNNIKMIGSELTVEYPLILSGTKVFSAGSLNDVYTTTFFNSAIKSSTSYNRLTGVDVGYIDGWSQSSYKNYSDIGKGEMIVYLSGGKWYMGGKNLNNVFATALTGRDDIIISAIGVNANVSGFSSKLGAARFTDCLQIASKDGNFPVTQGGDSGTAVFALLSSTMPALSTWKCIGLIFAGPTPTNTAAGIVCRIDNIVDQLKIKPWDGTIPTTQSKISNITYASTLTAIPTITLSGREYYNIGLS